jgi:alpha-amylase/alpha-mannosidase (GH57 family)
MEVQFDVVESTAVYNDAASSQSLNHVSALEQTLARGTTHGVYVTLHGHFYQPPRENPYLDAIERQTSAAPFHNWNERIYHECYRPNAFARILNDAGEAIEIVNNYEYLSFNIGPTLMRWLEQYDTEVYQRILEADRKSCDRLNGHGNAIAQVYNHIILPLANRQDKVTQIRWGKADFEARFGRKAEGMWLAEAAVDYATLEVLIEEGIKFIVLAPSQVERCRPLPPERDPEGLDYPWQDVGGGQIDPTHPYRCFLPGDESRYIDIFVYDGPISRDMGFGDVLHSSDCFADRIGQAVRGDRTTSQLVAVATDGETFGHHKHNTEKALAYAFRYVLPQRGWTITNFAHYLSLHPPTWEVEIKSVTAWSCAHGVDRWQDNCGCGGEGGVWHQDWRRPLRDALDWLRDRLVEVYLDCGDRFFQDPWAARNDYVSVLLAQTDVTSDPSDPIDAFLARHQRQALSATEQVDALRLLEMQRHALLMYTSCGWFFEELSRPEGVQILRYAARAIALAGEVAGVSLEPEFIERLALAPSNVEDFKTGDAVYRQLVLPSQVTLHQVVAHYAMSSLFHAYPAEDKIYSYQMHQWDYDKRAMGKLTLAVGHLQLISDTTRESTQVIFAVLHLGGWDFHCTVQSFTGRPHYTALKQELFEQLQQASTPRIVLAMNQHFGDRHYGIQDLFAEDRHRLLAMLSQETLTRLDQLYTQVYRDNYSLLMAYRQDGFEGPQEVLMAAQVALAHRTIQTLQALTVPSVEGLPASNYRELLVELAAIATETEQLDCRLNLESTTSQLDRLLRQWLKQVLYGEDSLLLQNFIELLSLTRRLYIPIQSDRLQEQYAQFLREQWVHRMRQSASESSVDTTIRVNAFLKLGQLLAIEMRPWLALLQYSGN